MDVGTTLRTARERQNLTLEDVARSTRISSRLLLALEQNAFHKLPGGIFARGFVRAYAREVGLDPQDMVDAFAAQTVTVTDAASGAGQVSAGLAAVPEPSHTIVSTPSDSRGHGWGYIAVATLLLIALASYTRSVEHQEPIDEEPFEFEVAGGGATDTPAVRATTGNDASDGHVAEADALPPTPRLRVDIAATGPCWVEAVADGETVVYRLMQAGERATFEAARDVSMLAGDPAAFTFTVNGQSGVTPGRAGVPARVTFTRDSYRSVLASR